MKGLRLLPIVLVALLGAGCSSSYLLENPRTFETCMDVGIDAREKSFGTIYELVNRINGWRIDSVDQENYQFRATVSRGRGFIPVLFSAKQNGAVEVLRDPERPKSLSRGWANNLKRWLDRLENHYSQKRCM